MAITDYLSITGKETADLFALLVAKATEQVKPTDRQGRRILLGAAAMTMTSTVYTIGTALNRAHDNRMPVALLVEGQWMHGHVVAVDGHGLVLDRDGLDHCVVKLDRVSAVRVMAAAPVDDDEPSITTQDIARHDARARVS